MKNKRLRVFIGEDMVIFADHLSDIVESMGHEVVGMAHDKESIIKQLNELKPDLTLLDIRMKGKFDGIEIGKYMLENLQLPFIYITAHFDNAIIEKAADTKPMAYLVKPYKPADVIAAISIACKTMSVQKDEYISLKLGYDTIKIACSEILYFNSKGNYAELITTNKRYHIRSSLTLLQESLNPEKFIQIHRSYIINADKVNLFKRSSLIIGSVELPISRKYQANLRKFLL